jgi:DNA-binding protein HU-beta
MNTIVNKVDLTKDLTDHLVDIPQATVKKVMDAVWEVIKNKLAKGEQISIAGFGSFYVKSRAARMGRNPKTGEQIQIEATKSPGFKAGKQLKDALKKI